MSSNIPAGSWKKTAFIIIDLRWCITRLSPKAGSVGDIERGVAERRRGHRVTDEFYSPLKRWDRCRPANSWRSVPGCEPCSTWVRTAVGDWIGAIGLCGDCGGRAVRSVNDDFYPWGLPPRLLRGVSQTLRRRPMCIAVGSRQSLSTS